ncbi:MAG: hypothetical protein RL318_1650 [Fibrobacterota bacterium]
MITRLCLAASLLLLGGCASTLKYPLGQSLLGQKPSASAWSAASVRAQYDLQWKTRRNDLRFHADLRTLGSMGRLDLRTPAGTALARIFWNGEHWNALFPGSSTLVEGEGPTLPLPMLGIAQFPLKEMERLARGVLLPPEIQGQGLTSLYSGKGTRVLLTEANATGHRWALHIEEKTGVVRRVQRFQGPVQEADLQIESFLPNTLIPAKIRREFDTASVLSIQTTGWSDQNFVSPTELSLSHPTLLDTVSISQDRLGRRFYTIRPSRPDSLEPFPSNFLTLGAPVVNDSVDLSEPETDSTSDSLDAQEEATELTEEELAPDESAPHPASLPAPALPAILKELPVIAPARALEPKTSDSIPLAPPPSESTPRHF